MQGILKLERGGGGLGKKFGRSVLGRSGKKSHIGGGGVTKNGYDNLQTEGNSQLKHLDCGPGGRGKTKKRGSAICEKQKRKKGCREPREK